jgi:hypothetical protein
MNSADHKLKKILGCSDDDIDISEDNEEHKRERHNQRKEEIANIKKQVAKLKDSSDEEFVKDALKEVASIGLESLRVLQNEVEDDPSGRAVECMAAMSNSVATALKNLQGVEVDKQKIAIEKEKVEVKRLGNKATANIGTVNNNYITTNVSDILDQMKEAELVEPENIETTETEDEGTVFGM